jgi:hypothetical protein
VKTAARTGDENMCLKRAEKTSLPNQAVKEIASGKNASKMASHIAMQ